MGIQGRLFAWPPLYFPLPNSSEIDFQMEPFHRRAAQQTLRQNPWFLRRFCLLLAVAAWPFGAVIGLLYHTVCNGSRISRATGKTVGDQFSEQWHLLVNHCISSRAYYGYQLYEEKKLRYASRYIHRYETKSVLFGALNRARNPGFDSEVIFDKTRFASMCNRHALPTIPILMEMENGGFKLTRDTTDSLPRMDIIVKPATGKGGRGIMRFDYIDPNRYRAFKGATLTESKLAQYLLRASHRRRYIIQPRCLNHPHILDLTGDVLSTIRILTAFNESNEVEVIRATMKIPAGDKIVDNYHQGGIAAAVDLSTGRLGRCIVRALHGTWLDQHPVTGVQITGRILPRWPDTLGLVERAHKCFDDFVFLAWDVAILDDGPVLVEANNNPGLDLLQTPHEQPLGDSRFAEIAVYHLKRLNGKRGFKVVPLET